MKDRQTETRLSALEKSIISAIAYQTTCPYMMRGFYVGDWIRDWDLRPGAVSDVKYGTVRLKVYETFYSANPAATLESASTAFSRSIHGLVEKGFVGASVLAWHDLVNEDGRSYHSWSGWLGGGRGRQRDAAPSLKRVYLTRKGWQAFARLKGKLRNRATNSGSGTS